MKLVNITASTGAKVGRQSAYRQLAGATDAGAGKVLHPSTVQLLGEGFQERFWVFVNKTDSCWLWTAGVDAYGYGQIHRTGLGPIKAHRAMWILTHGPITSKQHVLHNCPGGDNVRCVNPAHLFLGDQNINMKDAAAKGRFANRPHHGARRLSVEAERELLAVYAQYPTGRLPNGLRAQLAERFGVSEGYVSQLGRKWKVRAA